MFSLINDFLNDINLNSKTATQNKAFKYVNFNNEIFYLQNFKDIISFSPEEIIIKLNSGEIQIFGNNLRLEEISHKYLCVNGKINKIEVINA